MFFAGASRSTAMTPKSATPTSRPSSAKKIPVAATTPAKGEKELEAQVTHLTEQVRLSALAGRQNRVEIIYLCKVNN